MRFTIGGMGLSGSTLCYNIFRLTSKLKSYPKPLKIHIWDFVTNNSNTIFTIRDLRDTIASMIRKDPNVWGDGKYMEAASYQMDGYYKSWEGKRKDIIWKYEDYKSNPYEYFSEVAQKLSIPISDDEIKMVIDMAENIKNSPLIPVHQDHLGTPDERAAWGLTKLSKRHITNGGKIGDFDNFLTEEQIRNIESKYRYFFEEHGYELKYK